jgi:DNA adenine methylase
MKRTLFRYFGGKWRVAPWITGFFPEHREYCEPFCGAASVLFYKPKSYSELINDLNGDIINFYRVLQNDVKSKKLHKLLTVTPYSRDEYDLAHIAIDEPVERARRLLIRSMMSYNPANVCSNNYKSGFRNDINRRYTVPAHDWMTYPAGLTAFIERLRGVTVENIDALVLIEKQIKNKDMLLYLDPPYPIDTRWGKDNTKYEYEFSDEHHRQLVALLLTAKSMTVLSGYNTDLYAPLENDGWRKFEKEYQINFSGKRTECLWINRYCLERLECQNNQGFFNF